MLNPQVRRLLEAYPAIFLACHRAHVRSDESGENVTEHQASVLDHLDAHRPTTISKLAEHMGIGISAMSIAVSRLERAGYILRTRDFRDGRRVELKLTQEGSRIKEQNTVLDPELVSKIFSLMQPGEIQEALAGIEKLAHYARIILRQRKRRLD